MSHVINFKGSFTCNSCISVESSKLKKYTTSCGVGLDMPSVAKR